MKFNLASILARVGFTKAVKRDVRTYGYAPASPAELAVWNSRVATRQVLRRPRAVYVRAAQHDQLVRSRFPV